MAQSAQTTNVFQEGDIHWKQLNVNTSTSSSSSPPPKPLLIFTPTVPGEYPVILFCHGFCTPVSYYSKLLTHIVSHGFIVVAPQMMLYGMAMTGAKDVEYAGRVVGWISEELQPLLPENVEAKLEKLVLAGHSKGGKTSFAVALGYCQTKLNISAIVSIDPVAGLSKCKIFRTRPYILTGRPQSFDLKKPVMVIGCGLGPEKLISVFPPCAPEGLSHEEFFKECKPPCAHFVAKEYGHMDMLDDDIKGIVGTMQSKCMCKNGKGPRDLMRRTIGGLVVAFLRAHLDAQWNDFDAILGDPDLAPAKLEDVVYVPA